MPILLFKPGDVVVAEAAAEIAVAVAEIAVAVAETEEAEVVAAEEETVVAEAEGIVLPVKVQEAAIGGHLEVVGHGLLQSEILLG